MWSQVVVPTLELAGVLAGSALLFGLIEWARPADGRQGFLRFRLDREAYSVARDAGEGRFTALRRSLTAGEGFRADLVHSFLNPPVIHAVVAVVGAVVLGLVALMGDPRVGLEPVVAGWPFWVQVLVATVVSDFLGYWRHRTFHTSALWPVHAVHHSSTQLDWLSTRRFHPLNQIVTNLVHILPLHLLGIPIPALGATLLIRGAYGTFVHANVDLSYGPLDRVFVSPRFHRWHHSSDEEAIDCNFATLFSAWDWIFGTAYLPGRSATAFGLHGERLPESWLAHLGHPVETWLKRPEVPASDAPVEG